MRKTIALIMIFVVLALAIMPLSLSAYAREPLPGASEQESNDFKIVILPVNLSKMDFESMAWWQIVILVIALPFLAVAYIIMWIFMFLMLVMLMLPRWIGGLLAFMLI